MGRTVSYSVVKRNNPLDQDAVPKFYAQAQANGHVEIREMADRIQKTCTVRVRMLWLCLLPWRM